jgi:hypothetical protein
MREMFLYKMKGDKQSISLHVTEEGNVSLQNGRNVVWLRRSLAEIVPLAVKLGRMFSTCKGITFGRLPFYLWWNIRWQTASL